MNKKHEELLQGLCQKLLCGCVCAKGDKDNYCNLLQPIKIILEAWEVVKKDFILEWNSPNDASGYYLEYFGDIEYEKIKKALEIEDEKED